MGCSPEHDIDEGAPRDCLSILLCPFARLKSEMWVEATKETDVNEITAQDAESLNPKTLSATDSNGSNYWMPRNESSRSGSQDWSVGLNRCVSCHTDLAPGHAVRGSVGFNFY